MIGDKAFGSPALGDIDGDGKQEVIVGSYNRNIYALNGENGSFLWSYTTGGSILSSPALGDIDGDGRLEGVVGSYDGKVYALNGENGSFLWSYTTGDTIAGSPALGDIDGDGRLEIVVGSYDGKVYALNGDGSFLWSYTTGGAIYSSPAFGDIDGEGNLEVVIDDWYNFEVYALGGRHTGVEEKAVEETPPKTFALKCTPNPILSTSVIELQLPQEQNVSLSVYNATGQLVRILAKGVQTAGRHTFVWDGRGFDERKLPSGVYFLRATAGDFTATEKVVITR